MKRRMGPRQDPVPLDHVIRAHGYTKRELAKQLGITDASFAQYVTGRFQWPTGHLVKLCEIMGLDQGAMLCMAAEQEGRYAEARRKPGGEG